MRCPPRFSHLVTRPVVVAKLWPTCAAAFNIDDDDAFGRMERAMKGPLHDDILAATWEVLTRPAVRPTDDELLETVAAVLKKRGEKPGKVASLTPGWNAFLVLADVRAGTASEDAQRLISSEAGRARAAAGLADVGKHLAAELTRR
jgi:hypothetical protein